MKPRIFIGSSSEGLGVAKRIKKFFTPDYNCYLWTDDIFKNNESFLDTLIKSASLFDFSFMVFAADDLISVRGEIFEEPRDNVLFEYGLFLGRVGIDRAFVIAEDAANLPSDLLGITVTRYSTTISDDGVKVATPSLEEGLTKLKRQTDENLRLGHLGLLPSTVAAISYFDNFVRITAEWIMENTPNLTVEGKEYHRGMLYIKIPDNLDSDIKDSAMVFYKKEGLSETKIDTKHRNYPVHFVSKGDDNIIKIYDMPTILNGIDKAIDLYFKVGHIGKTNEQQLAEDNEMGNFRRVLQILINEDAFCRECVKILD